MTWNLLVIALGVDFAHPRSVRQSADAVAPEDARHPCFGDFDAVIARQVPDALGKVLAQQAIGA